MFTGIIEEVGEVVEADAGVLRIRARRILEDAKLGDSIAINGVDLTVTAIDADCFLANVMPETYRRSNLGQLQAGTAVNLERSLRPTDRFCMRASPRFRWSVANARPEATTFLNSSIASTYLACS